MTAAPTWDAEGATDAELARAAAIGDRAAFAGIYDRFADQLHDFCVGMLRDRDGAADCVQDTFCTAATRLPQLRKPDKLRPWLYAIARNEALRRLRDRRRETPSEELPETMSHEPGPDTLAARTELADLIAEATGGLTDRDRAVLELAYRHGLDGPELAEALGISAGTANRMVHRLRETIERSLGALLVSRRARNAPDGCPELGAILDGWDGHFSVLMRKRIARHIESCPVCDEERRQLVSPRALLGTVPVFIPAPAWLRERTLSDIRLEPSSTPIPEHAGESGTADRHRKVLALLALFAAILVISLGLTIAWVFGRNTTINPADVSETAPKTATPTPAKPTPAQAPPPQTESKPTTVPALTTPQPAVTTQVQRPDPPVLPEPPPERPVQILPPSAPPLRAPTLSLEPPDPPSQPPVLGPISPRTNQPTRAPTLGPIAPPKQPPKPPH